MTTSQFVNCKYIICINKYTPTIICLLCICLLFRKLITQKYSPFGEWWTVMWNNWLWVAHYMSSPDPTAEENQHNMYDELMTNNNWRWGNSIDLWNWIQFPPTHLLSLKVIVNSSSPSTLNEWRVKMHGKEGTFKCNSTVSCTLLKETVS